MLASLLWWLAPAVLLTSLISGVFGMAGGMILMAIMLAFMPVAAAMVLHAITQMTANGWRALIWRQHVVWPIVGRYVFGLAAALALFGFVRYVPDRGVVLIALGLLPFLALALPERAALQADQPWGPQVCGLVNGAVQLLAGVSGPLLDVFFVRSAMDRRAVVATKAACQTLAHGAKLAYFGTFVGAWQAAALEVELVIAAVVLAAIGTSLSRLVLDRLTDHGFRRWTRRIIMAVGLVCLAQGVATYL
ncbi:sulfite exporter TauE/SafE family protein [Achromobacter sp. GG226]|uniref:sulfite exporter TauE/SafE family protein n=1 Tax=Verticiella alkaliphila TaxID=2779529 RepID=UPI001C0D480E|nr:sulfite exporter TauE/SafE family protein [Verticiella sp. GG226]MBU4611592.1 sulfite exporter TauE/SafE family protein [Verticiella sp. GG226]